MKEMQDAYAVAGEILKQNISSEDRAPFENLKATNVLVVPGQYDQIENVLDVIGIPHVTGNPTAKALKAARIMFVNCPGNALSGYDHQVRDWVADGGLLLTTDWAIQPLQRMFPDHIRWNGKTTRDECIQLDPASIGETQLVPSMGILDQPVWWLEGSSYPFKVSTDVEVLLTSKELKRRYGSSLVVAQWAYGQGKIRHMISHIYLQRTELRSREDKKSFTQTSSKYNMAEDVLTNLSKDVDLDAVTDGSVSSSLSATKQLFDILKTATESKPDNAKGKAKGSGSTETSETIWVG